MSTLIKLPPVGNGKNAGKDVIILWEPLYGSR